MAAPHPPDMPLRSLTPDERQRYDEDGVIVARGLFPDEWLDRMATAVDRIVARPTPFGGAVSVADRGFSGDLFLWKTDDDFRDWLYESPAARIAQQVLGTATVRHFYDQLFVKPAGCQVPTPWHHDVTFWPVALDSTEIRSIWITFDPVSPATSGLEFVRGSHRWPDRYKAVPPNFDPYVMDTDLPLPPDIDTYRDRFDLFSPDLAAGDCLIFTPHVVHGSAGNGSTTTGRRAFSSRWIGAAVAYDPRHATMPFLWRHGLRAGDALSGPLFPQVLPAVVAEELGARAHGPEAPDPALVDEMLTVMARYAAR